MAKFESLDDVLRRLPADRRAKIEKDADSLALAMEAARLKGKDVVGAKRVTEMPGGRDQH